MNPRPNGPSALRDGHTKWSKHRELRILDGTWKPFVPVGPAREHITNLRAAGVSVRSIAASAGIALSTIAPIAWVNHHQARTKVRPEIEAAILAVTLAPALEALPDGAHVPAAGTTRRIRALQAIGWPLDQLADRLGVHLQSLSRACIKAETVTVARARAVADLYDELSMTPGPSEKTRRRAAREGWPPPLAWDDDEIDDPDATPHITDQGRRGRSSSYDIEEAGRLLAWGTSLDDLARRLNVQPESITRRIERSRGRGEAA